MPTKTYQVKKEGFGKWFRKIPRDTLTSPGGIVLVFMAGIMEIFDLLPGGSLAWEIIPEIIFCFFLSMIADVPFLSHVVPFLIERIPGISDFIPTWLIRLFL